MGCRFGISPRGITQHNMFHAGTIGGRGREYCVSSADLERILGVRMVSTYFGENKLVQKNVFLHVGESDSRHDEQTADHQALAPCLEDQALTSRPTSVIRHFGF